jgi:FMN-dependent NADH-azoreductase
VAASKQHKETNNVKTILEIQSSARKTRSITRELSAAFLHEWLQKQPDTRIITRDLADAPPPFVTEDWIATVFGVKEEDLTPAQKELLAPSDELIAEVVQADVIVIATPMYNYGMPAALKAWFDQVIRIGKTFTFDLARGQQPIEPILSGKTLVILSSRGEGHFGPGGANESMNHLETHISSCRHFLGVESEPHLIHVDFQEFGDDRHKASKEKAFRDIHPLVSELSHAGVEA